jgi:hypothetical protein
MIWAVMGIGMLINTIQGAKMRSKVNQQGAVLQQQMNQVRAEMGRTNESLKGGLDNFKPRFWGPNLSIHVDYPEQAYKNLNQMQQKHLQERNQMEGKLRQSFSQNKENFFKSHHYQTRFGEQGKGQVLTDRSGKPLLAKGAESPEHRAVRQHFESSQRLSLSDKHGKQLESLVKQEASQVKAFLNEKAALLGDAGVQQELQKMIVSSKKKALKLQQDQDEERWRVDMPPNKEIQEAVGVGLQEVRQMEARHVEFEETSPDHQAILQYERDFATAMADERARAAARKDENRFLMDPRKMRQRAMQGPPRRRFDEVLPGYLTASLFQMGIYQA